jgi:WD40 repeat protein
MLLLYQCVRTAQFIRVTTTERTTFTTCSMLCYCSTCNILYNVLCMFCNAIADTNGDIVNSSSSGGSSYRQRLTLGAHVSTASSTARAHTGAVTSLAFTPDGQHLLSSGNDNR